MDHHPNPASAPPITIRFNEGPPGCGKSRHLWRQIATTAGRHIYAAPHLRLVAEAEAAIGAFAEEAGCRRDLVVQTVTAERLRGRQRSVRKEIEDAARGLSGCDRAVLIVTHEGLMSADLRGFSDWTLSIDEVINVCVSGTMKLPALWRWMSGTYRLSAIPGTGGWSEVSLVGDAVTAGELQADTFLSGLADFHRMAAARRALFADVPAWEDLRHGREMGWWSLWEPEALRPFREVFLAGNAFSASATRQLWERWDNGDGMVRFEPFNLPPQPPRTARGATVHHFAEDAATSDWWNTKPEGREAIERIVRWLQANAPAGPDGLLWTANDKVRPRMQNLGLGGTCERPLLSGINAYRHVAWTAMIYSAKLLPTERRALILFELDEALIRRSREFEGLIQFAGRGALRDPGSGQHVHICVYDRAQAEFVAEHLRRHALADPVSVVFEDVGILRRAARRSKPIAERRPEQQERIRLGNRERKQRSRANAKERARSPSAV